MPLYDCMMLAKSTVSKELLLDLVARVGKHVYKRNGVVADIKCFGVVQLGYGIKKLDGRHFQGQLMQMTVMTPPSFNNELSYLNKEDRLLRWLLVKHRDVNIGHDNSSEFGDMTNDLFSRRMFDNDDMKSSSDDEEPANEDAYEADQSGTNVA